MQHTVKFSGGTVRYLLNTPFGNITDVVAPADCIIITDSNVAQLHGDKFREFKAVITIPAGEEHKSFTSILSTTQQLLDKEAHRKTVLIGIGGGMVTDLAGFIASIYMRGISFGYVPTSLLGMVDASIGGKNSINIGLQKNLLGTFNQPDFILFDNRFLSTLPVEEWTNGFAEVIKYACLFDKKLFSELAENNIEHYRHSDAALAGLVARCVDWKNKIVVADEDEKDMRKLLNFGHTAGHAVETICKIPHGQAVGIGMLIACKLSEQYGLDSDVTQQLETLLQQYKLPVSINSSTDDLMAVLKMDKKRNKDGIDFIILEKVGKAAIRHVDFNTIREAIEDFTNASNN